MFNNRITSKAIGYYIVVLFLVNMIWFNHSMDPIWWVFGIVAVVGLFKSAQLYARKWERLSEKRFVKKIFVTALILRIVVVVFLYYFYTLMTGSPFEFYAGDVGFYHSIAEFGAQCLWDGKYDLTTQFLTQDKSINFSDMGYPVWLSIVYAITGKSILLSRIIKAVLSAWTVVLIYKIADRNFGNKVARLAAVLMVFWPNFSYYAASTLKETEMVFLAVLFMEQADYLIRGKNFSFKATLPILLIAGALFMFRTALAAVAIFAVFTAVFLTSSKVLKMQKKIVLSIWVGVTVLFFVGGTVANEIEELWNSRRGNQEAMLEFRATRADGNKFAKKAGAAVFAPMIFVIPFPTMITVHGQENQQLMNGANYNKNILAFFVIYVLFHLIKTGKWRDYLLIASFTLGYLIVIAFSAFAQSERFHLPALPFVLIFAAYGISIFDWKKHGKYFDWWLLFIFVAIVGWSWFKLAGRGLA